MTPEVKETYLNELNGKSRFFRAFECTYSFYFGNLTKENEEEEIFYQKRCHEKLEKEKMEKENGEKYMEKITKNENEKVKEKDISQDGINEENERKDVEVEKDGEKEVENEEEVEEEKEVESPVQSSRIELEKLVGFRL